MLGSSFSFFCMYQSSSPNTNYWRGSFYSIVCLCSFCQILIDHIDMGLFPGFLFCPINLCVCSYANIRLSWLQWFCNIVWYQVLWSFQLCPYFSVLLRLFGIFLVPHKFLYETNTIEIISSILSDHNVLKLETNLKEKTQKYSNTWRLNNCYYIMNGLTMQSRKKLKKYLETNENEHTTTQNLLKYQ